MRARSFAGRGSCPTENQGRLFGIIEDPLVGVQGCCAKLW